MSKTFNQAAYGYVGGVSMANAGCGPSALAAIIYNKDTGVTPAKVADWLRKNGYFSENGTTRTGVTRALAHYGFQSLYLTPEHSGNIEWKTALEVMKATHEGRIWAIALVVGRKNGGKSDYWTSGGHFLAITDYKDGMLYVRDSGSRNRTGYHSPDLLKGDVNAVWIITEVY